MIHSTLKTMMRQPSFFNLTSRRLLVYRTVLTEGGGSNLACRSFFLSAGTIILTRDRHQLMNYDPASNWRFPQISIPQHSSRTSYAAPASDAYNHSRPHYLFGSQVLMVDVVTPVVVVDTNYRLLFRAAHFLVVSSFLFSTFCDLASGRYPNLLLGNQLINIHINITYSTVHLPLPLFHLKPTEVLMY
jgi:hypothetical protein